MKSYKFITFEGPEGSGKSTQIQLASRYLKKLGYKVLILREPGSTTVSEAIRSVLLDAKFKKMAPTAELLLYLAARAQLVYEKIMPALRQGTVVICDRFEDSTLAYQGYGRGFNQTEILRVSQVFVRGDLLPGLTFLLSIDADKGMKRGGRVDRMEKQPMEFHQKVQLGFLDLARKNPRRFKVIDAAQSIELVQVQIKEKLDEYLRR